MRYLLDTNLVSEVMKKTGDTRVLSWVSENEAACFLSAITVGEIEKGIELLPTGRKKQALQRSYLQILSLLEVRVLDFDLEVARKWATLTAVAVRAGRTMPVLDSMIEATALQWNLIIVTRNVSDFIQAPTLNPWKHA